MAYEVDYRKMMNLASKINISKGFVVGKYNNPAFEAFIWAGLIR